MPGNAPDNLGAPELVEQSETNTGVPVEETMDDAAYGDGDTRQAFAVRRPHPDCPSAGAPESVSLPQGILSD